MKSAYITYQPDLAVPRAARDLKDLVTLAKKHGVEHMVLLSGRGEDGAQQAEQILIDSGLEWNVVRASWFAQNFSESFMAQGIQNGELILPASAMREPFIDVEDIAR
ncbi:SDR family oxidoreductase [Marinomonas epiphytica]